MKTLFGIIAVMALMAAVQILQLRQAREGNTEKQNNPWPKNNLAWASWVIERLGGLEKVYESAFPRSDNSLRGVGTVRKPSLFPFRRAS
jgi:hypothetical protein